MKHFIFFLITACLVNRSAASGHTPDSTLNLIDKGVIATKLVKAKDKLYTRDYRGAMIIYREVIEDDPKNATALYFTGECQYGLFNYEVALEYVNKALAIDPKVNREAQLLLGNILLRLEKIDEAQAAYEKFKSLLKETEVKDYEISRLLDNCKVARELLAKPLQVTIKNMGSMINSINDDYSPLLSPDGQTFYFTSRRPGTGNAVAFEGDHKYFEDIYSTTRDESGNWQQAMQLDAKVVVEGFDNCGHITADGSTMYVTYNVDGFTKGSDIAVSKKSRQGTWNLGSLLPKKGVNTTYFEASPTLPEDESYMYFVSDRPGGQGGTDLWRVNMKKGRPSGAPVVIPSLNSPYDETTPWLHPSGKYIIFSSEGFGSMGGYDVFISEFKEGTWTTPKNLGYPINSTDDDIFFRVSPDGKTAFFASVRKDGKGDKDIYEVDISSLNLFGADQ